jgi:predicted DNA-binding transcriptional regulator AlpA
MSHRANKGLYMTTQTRRYLGEADTARLLGVSRRTLQRYRVTGDGPAFVRLGVRRVAYPEAGVIAWAEARTFQHRAAEMAGKVTV